MIAATVKTGRLQRARTRQQISDADRKRAQKQLEDETKARFEAIQKEAAKGK